MSGAKELQHRPIHDLEPWHPERAKPGTAKAEIQFRHQLLVLQELAFLSFDLGGEVRENAVNLRFSSCLRLSLFRGTAAWGSMKRVEPLRTGFLHDSARWRSAFTHGKT